MVTSEQQPQEFMVFKGRHRLPVCVIGRPGRGLLDSLQAAMERLAPFSKGTSPVDVTAVVGVAPHPVRLCTRRLLAETNDVFTEIVPSGYQYSLTPEAFWHFYGDMRWPDESCPISVLAEYLMELSKCLASESMRFLVLGDLPSESFEELRQWLGVRNVFSESQLENLLERIRCEADIPVKETPQIMNLPEAIQFQPTLPPPVQSPAPHDVIVGALAVANSLYLPISFDEPTQVKLQFLRDEKGDCHVQQGFPTVYAENEAWSVIDLDKEFYFGRLFRGEIRIDGKSVQFVGSAGTCLPPAAKPTQKEASYFHWKIAAVILFLALLATGGWLIQWTIHHPAVPVDSAVEVKGELPETVSSIPASATESSVEPEENPMAWDGAPGKSSVNENIVNFSKNARANTANKTAVLPESEKEVVEGNDKPSAQKRVESSRVSQDPNSNSEALVEDAGGGKTTAAERPNERIDPTRGTPKPNASSETTAGGRTSGTIVSEKIMPATVSMPNNSPRESFGDHGNSSSQERIEAPPEPLNNGTAQPPQMKPSGTAVDGMSPPVVPVTDILLLTSWNADQQSGDYRIKTQHDVEKLRDILNQKPHVDLTLHFDGKADNKVKNEVRNLLKNPREERVKITLEE